MATHPKVTFVSTKAVPQKGSEAFELVGDLTIHGVTKSVRQKAEGFTAPVKDPWGNTKTGTSATVVVDRKDFGLSWNKALEAGGVVVGDEVHIQLDLELTLKQ